MNSHFKYDCPINRGLRVRVGSDDYVYNHYAENPTTSWTYFSTNGQPVSEQGLSHPSNSLVHVPKYCTLKPALMV